MTNAYSGGFFIRWDPAFGADGYRLELATDSGFRNPVPGYDPLDVGHVLGYSVSGLPPGTFYVRVFTYNGNGVGRRFPAWRAEIP